MFLLLWKEQFLFQIAFTLLHKYLPPTLVCYNKLIINNLQNVIFPELPELSFGPGVIKADPSSWDIVRIRPEGLLTDGNACNMDCLQA
ncbi:MAG TPA: hypothetical protein VI583_12895 [Cyclobacteriaceae bacterium]|nr:hypothetical protein [Cyclobacteriaceae bacterium]